MNKQIRLFLLIFLISILGTTKLFSQDKDVLFLVDDAASLSTSDAMIELMMTNSGYTVFTTTADNSVVGDTLDMELVVISSTVSSGDVRDKFKWIELPILVWENGAFDDFGMTDTDLGSIALDVPVIDLVNDTHPLATGLTAGEITVLTQPERFTHGTPFQAQGNSSVLLATLFDGTDDIGCWFVYEVGDSLAPETSGEDGFPADGLAVGMRIGLPFEDKSFAFATPEAATILLNSMDYAVDGMMEAVVPSAYVMIDGPDALSLAKGQTSINPGTIFPSNVTDNTIIYSSGNDAVATYIDGTITAIESGETYVFAQSGEIKDSVFVQVKQPVQVTPDNLGIYMFEAEDFNSTQAVGGYQWEITGDTLIPGFSGGLGIQSTPPDGDNFGNNDFETGSPYVTYDIDFQEAGMYYIWFRASSLGSENQNSFHAGMDNGTDTTLFVRVELFGEEETGWQWGNELKSGDRVAYEVTTPGVHTLIVWNREAGFILDKIAITSNADLQMAGMTDIVGFYSEFEAENFAFSNVVDDVYSWEIVDEVLLPGMSEMHAVQASPGDSVNNFGNNSYVQDAPSMTYLVNFAEAGTYYFWARGNSLASQDKNSYHMGFSNGTDTTFFTRAEFDGDIDTWQWGNELKSGDIISIDITSPGLHEMIIWAREIGTVLDKFAFTTRENLMVNNVTPINDESFEIEAEDYSYTFEPDDVYSWELVGGDSLVSGMSNSLAIQALPEGENFGNSGYQTEAPSANYYVDFKQAGTYYYYARANSLGSGNSNSYHVGISNGTDTTSFTRAEVSSNSSDWQWANMLDSGDMISYEVTSPGMHEVIIWARETGIVIDKFILVSDLNTEPSITLTPSATTVEQGGDITLSAVASDDIAIDHVEFFLDGQSIGSVNVEPFDLQYTIPNDVLGEVSFSAVASDMLGLTNADTVSVTVTDAAIGVDGVTLDQNAATIEVDATVQLIATVSPANAADQSVAWSSDDDNIATVDNNGLVTGVAMGTTNVTVTTNDGGYTATAVITVTSDVSVAEFSSDHRFNIYPNPVQDNLYIEGENIKTISIYSTTGSLLMVVDENISNGMNVSALKSGLYIIKIEGSDFKATSGFVKKQ